LKGLAREGVARLNRWIQLRKLDATNYLFKYRGLTSLAPRNLSFAREYGIAYLTSSEEPKGSSLNDAVLISHMVIVHNTSECLEEWVRWKELFGS
jgi:hypothetical protein